LKSILDNIKLFIEEESNYSMDKIKESFQNVKEDMDFFYNELYHLKSDLAKTQANLDKIYSILEEINLKISKNSQKPISTNILSNLSNPTYNPTDALLLEPLKPQNKPFSNGNEGVPTDRQTNQQTDNQQKNILQKEQNNHQELRDSQLASSHNKESNPNPLFSPNSPTPIDDAVRILNSLDSLKKEIRLKFKMLTEQETAVFSTLYQIDEETGPTDYKTIAARLNLTESSIRDYVGRLIKKGIPVDKKKMNNKLILLSVSENLKKVASLPTILELRDL